MKTTIKVGLELQAGLKLRADLYDRGGYIIISKAFVIKVYKDTMEMILSDNEGKRIFGGEITISGYKNSKTNIREIKFNKGSMGSFDLSCEASVQTTLLLAHLISNYKEFAKAVTYAMDEVTSLSK